jgi:hypothetical protein
VTYTDLRSGRTVIRIERQFVTESYERFASRMLHQRFDWPSADCTILDLTTGKRRGLVHVDEPEV